MEKLKETLAVIPKKELLNLLKNKYNCSNEISKKIFSVRKGILCSELENTIKAFPVLKKSQILRLFEKEAYVKKTDNISGGRILRETLLGIVFALENYTGKKISREDSDAPLRYLEDACPDGEQITIEDFANFFTNRCSKLDNILLLVQKPAASRQTIKSYLADSCGIEPEDIDEKASIKTLTPSIEKCGEMSYYLVILWLEDTFKKTVNNNFIENKTIGDLIDFFTEK